jgi:type IV pilus assembly protein PilP
MLYMQQSGMSAKKARNYLLMAGVGMTWLWSVAVLSQQVQAAPSPMPGQIAPLKQGTIAIPSVPDIPRTEPVTMEAPAVHEGLPMAPQLPLTDNGVAGIGYDPSGRRDPFAPIIQELQPGKVDMTLPPLQRVTLTELNLIAIVWGAYGYTAMVQTPEGHGYTVRRGTRIGQNNGVVSAITERGIIVQERFTDVYGKKQEREYVKLLHPKEGSE